jgi:hypothetical protein
MGKGVVAFLQSNFINHPPSAMPQRVKSGCKYMKNDANAFAKQLKVAGFYI